MTNKLIIRYVLDPILKRPEQYPKQTTSFTWVSSLPYGEQHCPFFRASTVICTSFVSGYLHKLCFPSQFICGWEGKGRTCSVLCVGVWMENVDVLLFKQRQCGE